MTPPAWLDASTLSRQQGPEAGRPRCSARDASTEIPPTCWEASRRTSGHGLEHRPGLSEVGGVEALGEPGVDRRQEIAPLVAPALPVIQVREARRRTELERSARLGSGHVDAPPEAGLGPGLGLADLRDSACARSPASGWGAR